MNALCAERGVPVRTITSPTGHSSRYTDPQTRDLFVEAAAGVNAELIAGLQAHGVSAVGLIGERVVLQGERKSAIRAVVDGRVRLIRDDYSGSITGVDSAPLLQALTDGLIAGRAAGRFQRGRPAQRRWRPRQRGHRRSDGRGGTGHPEQCARPVSPLP